MGFLDPTKGANSTRGVSSPRRRLLILFGMKTPNGSAKKIFALCFIALLLPACAGQSADPQGTGAILIDAEPEASTVAVPDDDGAQRRRFVRVDQDALRRILEQGSGRLPINLFQDKTVTLVIERVERESAADLVAIGHIEGRPDSAATLVMNEGVLVANITDASADESYEVRFTGQGELHSVSQRKHDDGENGCEALPAAEPIEGDEPIYEPGADGAMATPMIDMLVAYTPAARIKEGGAAAIKALIKMGIADTNTALANSGANLRVRLAGTLETGQSETGAWSADLGSLRRTTDSRWNEVHAERKRLKADQVTLIGAYTKGGSTAGIGYISATKSYAFTIVKSNAFRMYTFSHELGHNIGLNHSDGYVNSGGRFRTIMAYGAYPRIRRFSNPKLPYNRYRTGTASANAVGIINANNVRMSRLLTVMEADQSGAEEEAGDADAR